MYPIQEQNNAFEFNQRELKQLGLLDKPYILGLKLRLAAPTFANVSCNLYVQKDGEQFPTFVKSSARTPFPNKRVKVVCGKVGRRNSRSFMPIPFDSFDELQKVKRIMILWTIKIPTENDEIVEYVIQDNVIADFESKEQAGIYGVSCYDFSFVSMAAEDNNADDFLSKHISVKDGDVVRSDILCGASYENACFFLLEDDALKLIKEYHAKDSDFHISPEDDFIFGVIGFDAMKRDMQSGTVQKAVVSYYRSVVTSNDRGILVV